MTDHSDVQAQEADTLQELLDVLDLEPLEVNLFRGLSPHDGRDRVFGGQVAAQALVAAGRTVEADRPVHSLHAYFLRPGDPTTPIIYEVDRIRTGRSFTTRSVKAIQHGETIFQMSASFQVEEPGPDHAAEMPVVPLPHEIPVGPGRLADAGDETDPVVEFHARPRPVELRFVGVPPWLDRGPNPPVQDVWLRTRGRLADDRLVHACALAYASDMALLGVAIHPHSTPVADFMIASLDHAMWFHRPFRADEWLLYHQESPSATGARGLAVGSLFRSDGVLAVTVVQEGLIRPITR